MSLCIDLIVHIVQPTPNDLVGVQVGLDSAMTDLAYNLATWGYWYWSPPPNAVPPVRRAVECS